MLVNKYKILLSETEKQLQIPMSMNLDLFGRGDTIDGYQETVIDNTVGLPPNYELSRYSCRPNNLEQTSLTYSFNFRNGTEYENSYVVPNRFNAYQIFYNTSPIRKSFFKMDFYDSSDPTNQRIFFTIILAPRQTKQTETKTYNGVEYIIKKPYFILDHVGEKESYYIYFFQNFQVTQLDTFYMKAKFFSGLDGQFSVFTTQPQTDYANPNNLPNNLFYYELKLDYLNRLYHFVNSSGQIIQSLNWYEYKNKAI